MEASFTVPVFIIIMTALLQYGNACGCAARFGSALCETGEKMAISAYCTEYGEINPYMTGVISDVYARATVLGKSGDTSSVEWISFLYTSYLREDDMVNLVMTYRVRVPVGLVRLPGIRWIQRGSVRGWTGRKGSGGGAAAGSSNAQTGTMVYVTEHGSVYHKDINCSHIRLSIRKAGKSELSSLRNNGGSRYKCCELCGAKAGSSVYITSEGDRYHSTLECGGLKRTVKQVSLEELEHMRGCSKCAAGEHTTNEE